MGFFSAIFGGPSQDEKRLAGNQSILATQMSQAFQSQLADQKGVLDNMNHQLTPIANLGADQQGYSPQELAAMNTQAINSAGAANRNARQAVGTTLAGQGGGGTNGLVSGIQQQIQGSIASSSANELAGAQNEITQRNYETGRDNFWKATAGESALAGHYKPEQYGTLATDANQFALKNATQIQAEKQQAINSAIGMGVGALTGGASFLSGGFGNLDDKGTSTSGEQRGNFLSGGISALAGL